MASVHSTPSGYDVGQRWSRKNGGRIAGTPDLEACPAFEGTAEEALREVEIAETAWLRVTSAEWFPIPHSRHLPAIRRSTG